MDRETTADPANSEDTGVHYGLALNLNIAGLVSWVKGFEYTADQPRFA